MARNSDRLTLRNELISKEYAQLFFVEGKRDEVIFDYLAEKYYLQPSTIEKIILKISKSK